jgi:hypothetical protein
LVSLAEIVQAAGSAQDLVRQVQPVAQPAQRIGAAAALDHVERSGISAPAAHVGQ